MKHLLLLVALSLLVGALLATGAVPSISPEYFKHVQGPPEEFGLYRLPNPQSNALNSESITVPAQLLRDEKEGVWKWEGDMPIDSSEQCVFTVISRMKKLQVYIKGEGQEFVELEKFVGTEKIESWYGWSEKDSVPSTSYLIKSPTPDVYTFKIVSHEAPPPAAAAQATRRGSSSSSSSSTTTTTTDKPSVFVMLYNKSPLQMHAHLYGNYRQLLVDQQIVMQTRVFDHVHFTKQLRQMNRTRAVRHGNDFVTPRPIVLSGFVSADMDIVMPDGTEQVIPMRDDGAHNDQNANDGVFGGSFEASQEGTYTAQVVMRGLTSQGFVFMRATQHVFTVIENDKLQIERVAAATLDPQDEMLKMHLRFQYDQSKQVKGQKFRAYAEVWGTPVQLSPATAAAHSSGTAGQMEGSPLIPVAFVSGMTIAEAEEGNTQLTMELQMSMKWLSKAQATLPLVLKNVYVQDASNNIPVAQSDHVVIDAHTVTLTTEHRNGNTVASRIHGHTLESLLMRSPRSKRPIILGALIDSLTKSRFKYTGRITEQMTVGKRPTRYPLLTQFNRTMGSIHSRPQASTNGKLILVHGYCAPESPWELSHFTDYAQFKDFDKSRTHDEFALLIREFADQFPAFSIAGHSQGGPAALHLKSFYWSNQDGGSEESDDNHRDLQSVGSPYNGNALAGDLASIGSILGVGCGVNYDLTRDGSSLWIASIPASARKHVYYYTTQYKDWSWCNLAANLVLSYPNDGVAEYDWSDLDGGNNCGHVKGQCHSRGMKYPAQCTDASRNSVINSKASRGF